MSCPCAKCSWLKKPRTLLRDGGVLRNRMPKSPGLFRQPTIPYRGAGDCSKEAPSNSLSLHVLGNIEPEHLSPDLVWAHGCAQTIPDTKFYSLCSGCKMPGTCTIYSEEISTHTCRTVHPSFPHYPPPSLFLLLCLLLPPSSFHPQAILLNHLPNGTPTVPSYTLRNLFARLFRHWPLYPFCSSSRKW